MNICLNCGKHTDNNKFCSKSCATIYNNKLRKPRTLESKQKTSDSIKKWRLNHCKQVTRCCKCCGKEYVFDSNLNTKTFCSKTCSEYYKTHRNEFLSNQAKNNISKGVEIQQLYKEITDDQKMRCIFINYAVTIF